MHIPANVVYVLYHQMVTYILSPNAGTTYTKYTGTNRTPQNVVYVYTSVSGTTYTSNCWYSLYLPWWNNTYTTNWDNIYQHMGQQIPAYGTGYTNK